MLTKQMTNDNIPNWVSISEYANKVNLKEKTVKSKCRKGELVYKVEKHGQHLDYYILDEHITEEKEIIECAEQDKYSEAPTWSKLQAEKYIRILKATIRLNGKELKEYINNWNKENPNNKTSYPSIIRMRKRYKENGINGLLAKYGANANKSSVKEEYFDYFKNIYLKEGAPSLYSCWESTLGYAIRIHNELRIYFPSHMAFKRKLEREIPKQSIYLARYGKSAWNRKYGNYIERDYSNIICGKVWVSDHAQIDIACFNDGEIVFPWVTAWRDYKSGKWLGWIIQSNHPNSDHIFQTFYYAAESFGLPEDVIIDNGKDYRCKDFAGGRKTVKINSEKSKTESMLSELNVNVHFALPYNAQTKPIERDFLKIKELLSKHCMGYRGGNIAERPEKLSKEIKSGKILPFDTFKLLFDDFINNVLNKKPSRGKNHQGLSPDDLFYTEYKEKVTVSKEALKLFCMRTSKTFTIGRNGIKDSEFGITYWADWMINKTGTKVYLRRDIKNYKIAWAFNANNDEFLGKVCVVNSVAALNANKISKEDFKLAMSNKKHNLKVAKEYIKQSREISFEEECENYKAAYKSIKRETNPKISIIANTNMDKVIRKCKEMEEFGSQDLSVFIPDSSEQTEQIYLFETDRDLNRKMKGAANGY